MNVVQALESALRAPRTIIESILHNEVLRLQKLLSVAESKLKVMSDIAITHAAEKAAAAVEAVEENIESVLPVGDPAIEAPHDAATADPLPPFTNPEPVIAPVKPLEPTPEPVNVAETAPETAPEESQIKLDEAPATEAAPQA